MKMAREPNFEIRLDTSEGSQCALCPGSTLDHLGHHAVTCKYGGDVVSRHNRIRDILVETCRRALSGASLCHPPALSGASLCHPPVTLMLRDSFADSCRLAHLSVKVEVGNNLTQDHDHSRPADVLVHHNKASQQHLTFQ